MSKTYLRGHIAKQDIKVEKVLYYDGEDLTSPVYGTKYLIGELAIGIKPNTEKVFYLSGTKYVVRQAFHSYKAIIMLRKSIGGYACHNIKNLNDFISISVRHDATWPIIAECTIPKGSVYYTHKGAYASEMIYINKIREIQKKLILSARRGNVESRFCLQILRLLHFY